jgi:hypothetical protein
VDTSKSKPDLLATSSASRGGKRILAQLEHGARPATRQAHVRTWTVDGWTVSLCLLLLAICSIAWMMHKKAITPASFKYSEHRSRSVVTRTHAGSPVTTPDYEQTAAIVNEASVTNIPVHQVTMAATTPVPTAVRTPRDTHAAQPFPQAAAARRNAGKAEAQPAAPAHDTDVTLLAALVAHANKPTVIVADRSRDVVERQEGDSTALLLVRCQQLGLIEGMLCRSRICSGRWEADAACRAPAH